MHSQQYFSKFWSWPVVINTSSVVIGHANKRMHITETSDWILTIIYLKKKKDSTFTALYISTFMCFYFHIVQKFYFTWLNRLAYFNCQLTLFFLFFFFWLCPAARGILVPWPGLQPVPPALEVWSLLPTGPPGKSLINYFYHVSFPVFYSQFLLHYMQFLTSYATSILFH